MTTEHSDWATNCPEYKVTAVEVRAHAREPLAGANGDGTHEDTPTDVLVGH